MTNHSVFCGILPPYLLRNVAVSASGAVAQIAERTLEIERTMRVQRELRATRLPDGRREGMPAPPGFVPDTLRSQLTPRTATITGRRRIRATARRNVYDAQHKTDLPGVLRRSEGDRAHSDESVNEAYDGLGATWKLFHDVYGRDSLDAQGLPLVASVHFDENYDNAFWDGEQMVFGDGDGEIFRSFTDCPDVIGHELSHGFTQYTTGFVYVGQSGALNEHISDVFGVLMLQRLRRQSARSAPWLVGEGLFTESVQGVALRSMKAPGTAYDDPRLGKDPQPATMSDYVKLPHDSTNDNGGVHINSGIPNHAFYLASVALGGYAWTRAGQVWYDVMTGGGLPKDCEFVQFAEATVAAAKKRYGGNARESRAIRQAWVDVEVLDGAAAPTRTRRTRTQSLEDVTAPSENTASAETTTQTPSTTPTKKAASKKAAPKKTASDKAAAKKATKKTAAEKAAPEEAASKTAPPKKAAPKKAQSKSAKKSDGARVEKAPSAPKTRSGKKSSTKTSTGRSDLPKKAPKNAKGKEAPKDAKGKDGRKGSSDKVKKARGKGGSAPKSSGARVSKADLAKAARAKGSKKGASRS